MSTLLRIITMWAMRRHMNAGLATRSAALSLEFAYRAASGVEKLLYVRRRIVSQKHAVNMDY